MNAPAPDKRLDANRRNARRSTGPRTVSGKARAAANSRKHGLAVPIGQMPGVEARIEEMARAISGQGADPTRLELARRVAEAQLDLVRIRDARRRLFEDPRARMKTLSASQVVREARRLLREADALVARAKTDADDAFAVEAAGERLARLIGEDVEEGDLPSLVEGFAVVAPQLLRLERYERRATSRRKTATRAYDAYCRSCELSAGEGTKRGLI